MLYHLPRQHQSAVHRDSIKKESLFPVTNWTVEEPKGWQKEIAHRGARTPDHQVKSLALYRLS